MTVCTDQQNVGSLCVAPARARCAAPLPLLSPLSLAVLLEVVCARAPRARGALAAGALGAAPDRCDVPAVGRDRRRGRRAPAARRVRPCAGAPAAAVRCTRVPAARAAAPGVRPRRQRRARHRSEPEHTCSPQRRPRASWPPHFKVRARAAYSGSQRDAQRERQHCRTGFTSLRAAHPPGAAVHTHRASLHWASLRMLCLPHFSTTLL